MHTPTRMLYDALRDANIEQANALIIASPSCVDRDYAHGSMLHDMASVGNLSSVRWLVDVAKFAPQIETLYGSITVLDRVISNDFSVNHQECLDFLLARGADPKRGRPIISAVRIPDEAKALEVATLLLDHGVDVNALYDAFGNPDRLFTALDHAAGRPALVELLKARGGKTAAELVGNERALHKQPPPGDATDPVVQFFAAHYGPVAPLALQEIVPGDPPLTLRVVPSPGPKQPTTVFTSGMAAEPLNCPPEWADEGFAHCECFLQLPAKWPYAEIKQAKHRWPFEWLARIARTPHQNGTWMGGLTAIFDNGSPPEPLASGLPFDSWLAINAHTIDAGEHGPAIRLYHLVPLHPAERELAEKQGVEAMLKALDKAGVGFAIDVKRPSAV